MKRDYGKVISTRLEKPVLTKLKVFAAKEKRTLSNAIACLVERALAVENDNGK